MMTVFATIHLADGRPVEFRDFDGMTIEHPSSSSAA